MNAMKKLILTAIAAAAIVSCSDWTQTEPLEPVVRYPWQESPQLWEEYKASVREYKERDHSIIYARLENSPEKVTNEKHFLRSLPDSLDIVTLTNAAAFSQHDAEDLAWVQSFGTKVLYHIDTDENPDGVQTAVSSVAANGLNGFSFTAVYKFGDQTHSDAISAVIDRLVQARSEGQLLVFEGNPLAIPADKRESIDYYVLNCVDYEKIHNINLGVYEAVEKCGLPAEKILLSAKVGAIIEDESKSKVDALSEMTERVVTYGNLGGLAVYDIEKDYYHYDGNYVALRGAIQTLNPSK